MLNALRTANVLHAAVVLKMIAVAVVPKVHANHEQQTSIDQND